MQTYEADMIDFATSDGNTPDLDSCCKRIMSSKHTISLYKMNRLNLVGDYKDTEQDILDYDLMNVIMICLGESRTKKCKGIIRMLHSLLVAEIPASEKKRIAHDEFGIPMNKEFEVIIMKCKSLAALSVSHITS